MLGRLLRGSLTIVRDGLISDRLIAYKSAKQHRKTTSTRWDGVHRVGEGGPFHRPVRGGHFVVASVAPLTMRRHKKTENCFLFLRSWINSAAETVCQRKPIFVLPSQFFLFFFKMKDNVSRWLAKKYGLRNEGLTGF